MATPPPSQPPASRRRAARRRGRSVRSFPCSPASRSSSGSRSCSSSSAEGRRREVQAGRQTVRRLAGTGSDEPRHRERQPGTVNLNGDQATVTVTTKGLLNGAPHAMHIHAGGRGECPPASAARRHNGHLSISTTDGIKFYGPPEVSLTSTRRHEREEQDRLLALPNTGRHQLHPDGHDSAGRRRRDPHWQRRDHRPRHRLQPQRRLRQRP